MILIWVDFTKTKKYLENETFFFKKNSLITSRATLLEKKVLQWR